MSERRTLISELQQSILRKEAQGKSQTARKMSFCLKKVQTYLDGGDIPLDEISAEWVEGFMEWMKKSLRDNTAATYMRLIHNIIRTASKEGADVDPKAFGTVDMGNAPSARNCPSAEDILSLRNADFHGYPALQHATDLYMLAFYLGGLEYADIANIRFADIDGDSITAGGRTIPLTPLAQTLLSALAQPEGDFVLHNGQAALSEDETAERQKRFDDILSAAASKAGILKRIRFGECGMAWKAIASGLAITDGAIDRIQSGLDGCTDAECAEALTKVAAKVNPDRPQWYAVRCTGSTPESLLAEITSRFPADTVKTFYPEIESYKATEKGAKKVRMQLLRNIVFFLAPSGAAKKMKTDLRDIAYVYDYKCGNSRILATIPSKDMKTFMYFNDIAPDKIAYFFPEEDAYPELEHKSEVMIIDGKWKGGTGKVVGPCKDDVLKTVVAVELPNLGITVSAPVPNIFLKRLSRQKPTRTSSRTK